MIVDLLSSLPDIQLLLFNKYILFGIALYFANTYRKELKSPLRKIPGPFYGSFTDLHLRYLLASGKIWRFVEEKHKQYGPVMRLGPRHVWIADQEGIKEVIQSQDLPKVAMYAEISRDRETPGLFGEIRFEPHKRLKKFLSPAFTVGYVDDLDYLFCECISTLLRVYNNRLMQGTKTSFTTDIMDDIHNVALDIMGECAFGKGFGQTDPESVPQEGVSANVWRAIPRSIFKAQQDRYRTVYVKRFVRKFGINMMVDWSADMIAAIGATVQYRAKNKETARHDLLEHVVEKGMRADIGTKYTTREVIDQLAELMLAGAETTSGTLGCFFLHIARNPEVRKKLLESLPALAPDDDTIVTGKDVRNDPQYEYLNACIQECLRLSPIASEMGRRTGSSWVKIGGQDYPPHTVISASYRVLHRDPECWPEAMRFWPERWLPEEKRDGAPEPCREAYYPFSAGRHACIGINFAWNELRVVTSNIMSRYDIMEVPDQEVDFRQYITMQFADGAWNAALIPRVQA